MAKVQPIPAGTPTVIPNLTIRRCGAAIDFYKKALGATEVMRAPAPDGSGVWHAELKIGESVLYMNDEMPGMGPPAPSPERPAPLNTWIWVKDCDAAYRRAVDAGAQTRMEPADMFWGDRTATVADPFGYSWTFSTHVKDMTPEEMQRAGEAFAKEQAKSRS
jgi:uncharacterized glyoxalase superfamily protein PhnB